MITPYDWADPGSCEYTMLNGIIKIKVLLQIMSLSGDVKMKNLNRSRIEE